MWSRGQGGHCTHSKRSSTTLPSGIMNVVLCREHSGRMVRTVLGQRLQVPYLAQTTQLAAKNRGNCLLGNRLSRLSVLPAAHSHPHRRFSEQHSVCFVQPGTEDVFTCGYCALIAELEASTSRRRHDTTIRSTSRSRTGRLRLIHSILPDAHNIFT